MTEFTAWPCRDCGALSPEGRPEACPDHQGSLHTGWAVETVEIRLGHYRFRTTGWNRYTGEPFTWDVPTLWGYDLSQAFVRSP